MKIRPKQMVQKESNDEKYAKILYNSSCEDCPDLLHHRQDGDEYDNKITVKAMQSFHMKNTKEIEGCSQV